MLLCISSLTCSNFISNNLLFFKNLDQAISDKDYSDNKITKYYYSNTYETTKTTNLILPTETGQIFA